MNAKNDAHCHFFSTRFLRILTEQAQLKKSAEEIASTLGWDFPGSPSDLAERWASELDQAGVGRAALIASVPGDEDSVAEAVRLRPDRFVGFFMVNANAADAPERTKRAFDELGLRTVCLFPAMHGFRLDGAEALEIFRLAAERPQAAAFVHCGVLTVGVRKKLGLKSRFDIRLGNPLDLLGPASDFSDLPFLIPHFGAGFFREALMLADLRPNVHFDTSSSNSWIKYHPGLTLERVFAAALDVAGPQRLLFGTDSSFFPRGWQASVWKEQHQILDALKLSEDSCRAIFRGNFGRLFPI